VVVAQRLRGEEYPGAVVVEPEAVDVVGHRRLREAELPAGEFDRLVAVPELAVAAELLGDVRRREDPDPAVGVLAGVAGVWHVRVGQQQGVDPRAAGESVDLVADVGLVGRAGVDENVLVARIDEVHRDVDVSALAGVLAASDPVDVLGELDAHASSVTRMS
jgi:hypothetical protein